jgi:hypothetical protein
MAGWAEPAIEDDPEAAAFFCGWGGSPRCPVRLDERGLCSEHASALDALTAKPLKPKPKPAGARTGEQYRRELAEAAAERRSALADRVEEIVLRSKTHPVRKAAVEAALGKPRGLALAIQLAVKRGQIVSRSHGAVPQRGYYPPA